MVPFSNTVSFAMDLRSPTPIGRRRKVVYTNTLDDSDLDSNESASDDPKDGDFSLPETTKGQNKRSAPSKPPHKRRRKNTKTLLTGQRQNVDETIKQLQPNADGPYCVVTRATREFAVLDYSHVLPVATNDEIVRTGYHVRYCLPIANDVL